MRDQHSSAGVVAALELARASCMGWELIHLVLVGVVQLRVASITTQGAARVWGTVELQPCLLNCVAVTPTCVINTAQPE